MGVILLTFFCMASLFSQLLSCWTGSFTTPEEWKTTEEAEKKTPVQETNKPKSKAQGTVVIKQPISTPSKSTKEEIPQEYESSVEWECWDDEEEDDQPKDIEVPTISLPSSIKATIIVNKPTPKEEPEEDFFSDMEPEPAKKVFLAEKP